MLAARTERARSRLSQAAIERAARRELDPATIGRLERLGFLGEIDVTAIRDELADLALASAALGELQAWVERRLAEEADDYAA